MRLFLLVYVNCVYKRFCLIIGFSSKSSVMFYLNITNNGLRKQTYKIKSNCFYFCMIERKEKIHVYLFTCESGNSSKVTDSYRKCFIS